MRTSSRGPGSPTAPARTGARRRCPARAPGRGSPATTTGRASGASSRGGCGGVIRAELERVRVGRRGRARGHERRRIDRCPGLTACQVWQVRQSRTPGARARGARGCRGTRCSSRRVTASRSSNGARPTGRKSSVDEVRSEGLGAPGARRRRGASRRDRTTSGPSRTRSGSGRRRESRSDVADSEPGCLTFVSTSGRPACRVPRAAARATCAPVRIRLSHAGHPVHRVDGQRREREARAERRSPRRARARTSSCSTSNVATTWPCRSSPASSISRSSAPRSPTGPVAARADRRLLASRRRRAAPPPRAQRFDSDAVWRPVITSGAPRWSEPASPHVTFIRIVGVNPQTCTQRTASR